MQSGDCDSVLTLSYCYFTVQSRVLPISYWFMWSSERHDIQIATDTVSLWCGMYPLLLSSYL